jgi:hypothetical protein
MTESLTAILSGEKICFADCRTSWRPVQWRDILEVLFTLTSLIPLCGISNLDEECPDLGHFSV